MTKKNDATETVRRSAFRIFGDYSTLLLDNIEFHLDYVSGTYPHIKGSRGCLFDHLLSGDVSDNYATSRANGSINPLAPEFLRSVHLLARSFFLRFLTSKLSAYKFQIEYIETSKSTLSSQITRFVTDLRNWYYRRSLKPSDFLSVCSQSIWGVTRNAWKKINHPVHRVSIIAHVPATEFAVRRCIPKRICTCKATAPAPPSCRTRYNFKVACNGNPHGTATNDRRRIQRPNDSRCKPIAATIFHERHQRHFSPGKIKFTMAIKRIHWEKI